MTREKTVAGLDRFLNAYRRRTDAKIQKLEKRLDDIAFIILAAENLAMATDGPVPTTISCMTDADIRRINNLARRST